MTAETSQQLARRLHLIQLIRCLNLPCQAEKGDAGIKCFNKAVPVSMYALNICVYKIDTWIWMCDTSINKYTHVNIFVHTWFHVIYLQSFWCRSTISTTQNILAIKIIHLFRLVTTIHVRFRRPRSCICSQLPHHKEKAGGNFGSLEIPWGYSVTPPENQHD